MKRKTAQNLPYAVDVIEGQTYEWCSCGLSQTQPFCDSTHQITDCIPQEYIATETSKVFFCGCKNSNNSPFCDGTHNKL